MRLNAHYKLWDVEWNFWLWLFLLKIVSTSNRISSASITTLHNDWNYQGICTLSKSIVPVPISKSSCTRLGLCLFTWIDGHTACCLETLASKNKHKPHFWTNFKSPRSRLEMLHHIAFGPRDFGRQFVDIPWCVVWYASDNRNFISPQLKWISIVLVTNSGFRRGIGLYKIR